MSNLPEMTEKEFKQIPFNNKTMFEEGMFVRLRGSECYVGGVATYYKRGFDSAGNMMLKPYTVKIMEGE